jgi:hypothetical protein
LRARIEALRASAQDADRRLDLEEAEAELFAVTPEAAP